jgi:hypothetical protein
MQQRGEACVRAGKGCGARLCRGQALALKAVAKAAKAAGKAPPPPPDCAPDCTPPPAAISETGKREEAAAAAAAVGLGGTVAADTFFANLV